MEPAVKPKDFNYTPSAFNQSVASAMCISDSFSIIPASQNDLVSANSIELNAAASLSDDSGVPLTTNSSISSGDSYRIEMCKFEIEMVESDGEVSQFDSLDNCSESGMSTENFNTLKKGPLAPIDPPPEFQDSPQATIVRSISKNIINNFRRWTSSQCPFEILKDRGINASPNETTNENDHSSFNSNEAFSNHDDDKTLKDTYSTNKHFYASDSVLNSHTDNIYDEPNNVLSSSLGNSVDNIESDSSSPLPSPPPPVSIKKIKQSMCPYFQDHSRYFKAIPSEQDNIPSVAQKVNHLGISDIHDYDLYYGAKRKTYLHYENSNQRKMLYSPFRHSLHCHNHIYHTGVNASGNRPNSRNSLSSRLSSSHNSLSVSSANKPDDSIFITQAMSHDALLTREISDFYNVPIDSDIYALPVDMIQTDKDCHIHRYETFERKSKKDSNVATNEHTAKCPQHKSHKRNNTNKRKKRFGNNCSDEYETSEKQKNTAIGSREQFNTKIASKRNECSLHSDENPFQEPLHMTLNEVQQFYQTLYLNTKSETDLNRLQNKTNGTKSSIETIWSVSSTRSRNKRSTSREKQAKNSKTNTKSAQKLASYSENLNNNNNNNNNVNALTNHKNAHPSHEQATQASPLEFSKQAGLHLQDLSPNNKQILQSEKKSQFTLNLKQKFCSIFRFRRRHNRCRSSSAEMSADIEHRAQGFNMSESAEDKRKKFQSRALPPLPKKVETIAEMCEEKKNKESEPRFQFTSSIEKVKDYGWYWGPLSSEAAEKVLSNEPDGSFLVRDSSDDHYIFSLSFKLNSCVRHVRIEQDQGTFSFGSYAKFKSQTITEFIEKAVDHSRSGRYLFFLHRRPEHGPMRVQLTNPVSRFKHVQSLQHMCRFVILKAVIRKDLLQTLPLPRRLLDYLNYKHCYSEQIESDSSHSQISEEGPF